MIEVERKLFQRWTKEEMRAIYQWDQEARAARRAYNRKVKALSLGISEKSLDQLCLRIREGRLGRKFRHWTDVEINMIREWDQEARQVARRYCRKAKAAALGISETNFSSLCKNIRDRFEDGKLGDRHATRRRVERNDDPAQHSH